MIDSQSSAKVVKCPFCGAEGPWPNLFKLCAKPPRQESRYNDVLLCRSCGLVASPKEPLV